MIDKITIEITISSNDETTIQEQKNYAIQEIAKKINNGDDSGYESNNHDEGHDYYTEFKFFTNRTEGNII